MGDVKNNMKTTPTKGPKGTKRRWWKKATDTPESVAETFADYLEVTMETLDHLIGVKEKDVTTEGAKAKPVNEAKLSVLHAMKIHLEAANDLAHNYEDI